MTNTTMFTCIATDRVTWRSRKFFSLRPGYAHQLALRWLAAKAKS